MAHARSALSVFLRLFEFRLLRKIVVRVIEYVGRSYRKQEHIVDYRDNHETDYRNKYYFIYLIEPVQIEYVESDIKVEERILQPEVS